jgi:hypothetical protein
MVNMYSPLSRERLFPLHWCHLVVRQGYHRVQILLVYSTSARRVEWEK